MLESQEKSWLVIVNPNAGKRKGEKDWKKISRLLDRYGFSYQVEFTRTRHHAIEIAREHAENGTKRIIVVGGDGTMNEVINGIFTQSKVPTTDITLSMITVGTGNDWGRMFHIPRQYEKAIQVIRNGNTILQDAGVVHYRWNEDKGKRYFVNIAGIGFDAVVVSRANDLKDRGKSGKLLYLWNILSNLFRFHHSHTVLEVDGVKYSNNVFSISIGIGKYSGGGMMQTPGAIANDGLFDITVIKKIGKFDVIRNIGKLYNGKIIHHPKVLTLQGKSILIDANPLIHVETDGESLGHSPIRFDIIPSSVRVICGTMPPAS
ncbi:MAG TPA: diacylglycerol kinase family lipid kinase [Bacteroidetes bacterium]|nr:diacylglycerol kinase family lipid kinase [Bacteroidota bacterium]